MDGKTKTRPENLDAAHALLETITVHEDSADEEYIARACLVTAAEVFCRIDGDFLTAAEQIHQRVRQSRKRRAR